MWSGSNPGNTEVAPPGKPGRNYENGENRESPFAQGYGGQESLPNGQKWGKNGPKWPKLGKNTVKNGFFDRMTGLAGGRRMDDGGRRGGRMDDRGRRTD